MLAVLGLAALALLAWAVPARRRILAWLAISVGAVYALQPPGPDFATATLVGVGGVWLLVRREPFKDDDRAALIVGGAVALGAALWHGTAGSLLIGLGLVGVSGTAISALIPTPEREPSRRRRLGLIAIGALIAALIVLKAPSLSDSARAVLTVPGSRPPPLIWFGFSYIAFRLIHVLIDDRHGRLPPLGLRDFGVYVLFFPALTAGPIDRLPHFVRELAAERHFEARYLLDGGGRIAWGLFRKFVVADLLSYTALNPRLAAAAHDQPLALWLMLYAYAFYIFFDFAGYTDIAIGIGLLVGVRCPKTSAVRTPAVTSRCSGTTGTSRFRPGIGITFFCRSAGR